MIFTKNFVLYACVLVGVWYLCGMKTHTTTTAEETQKIAQDLVANLKQGTVLALVGDLGAGKTTFTQGIAQYFKISDPVSSPTFALVQEYPVEDKLHTAIKNIIHVDCYRLSSSQDLLDIGIQDYFDRSDTLVIIEWADQVKDIIPQNAQWIEFSHGDTTLENQRVVTVK